MGHWRVRLYGLDGNSSSNLSITISLSTHQRPVSLWQNAAKGALELARLLPWSLTTFALACVLQEGHEVRWNATHTAPDFTHILFLANAHRYLLVHVISI